ncbi:sulfite exporter TauE/SafE family protein [uncultured Desulfobulbus sp.]|uniref:sulfite exporter TauE/SafE family protein n=1 Tax=uncultured Desulfobulbus sp. TaxID=239745 RepID=UPI0029C92908|nr:sulfite exporter TauE/SafE family protein [uncultured Desulfobulbus sp.]
MEWLYILMPIAGVKIFWPGLIILGIGVGIIGGFFGMGGAWMVTPGLNILGFPMAFAIGTDIAHMAGKSLISTMRHGKFGNVDYKLGIIMLVGTVVGFECGAQMVMWLERLGSVEKVVRWIYIGLLAFIAWMVFHDVAKRAQKERAAAARGEKLDVTATGVEWHKTLHKIKIPPMVHLEVAGIYCSAWLPIFVSFLTGWLAGILGIGGGLIRMPALIYMIGCPTHVAVGTDLFEVAISGLYGAATYTFKGRTELVAAMVMLVGAAMGAQVGAVATKYIKGYGIRIAFGLAVIGCALSILMKLVQPWVPEYKALLDTSSTVLVLGLVSAMSIYIFVRMIAGVKEELRQKQQKI